MNRAEHTTPVGQYVMSGSKRNHNYLFVDRLPLSYEKQILEPFTDALRMINPQATILDLGSGPGGAADYFDSQGFKTVRADVSYEGMKAAHGNKVIAEVHHLPFGNSTLDAVHIKDAMTHIERSDLFLRELSRVLKPEGALLITDNNYWGPDLSEPPYYYSVQKESLILMARLSGFLVKKKGAWKPSKTEEDWFEERPKRFVLTFRKV